jgi:hypothetical protein
MSAPVDVLAVMDAEIASLPIMAGMMCGHDGAAFDEREAVERLAKARAAVAELIDRADAALELLESDEVKRVLAMPTLARGNEHPRVTKLRAALARVQGEGA